MMKSRITSLLISLIYSTIVSAQTISGNISLLTDQPIKLEGFNGLETYPLAASTCDSMGNFTLNYTKADYGVGYLLSADNKPLIVILSGEDIRIEGKALSSLETIRVIRGQENQWFGQYAREHPKREQALSAWDYLEKIYKLDSLFTVQKTAITAIHQEKQRIKNEDLTFLESLPKDSYVHWFLPARKLVSSVSAVAQYRTEDIPLTIASFRDMDYSDPRLYKSGLLKDAIESHFWLIENSGGSLDSVYIEMKRSIDAMVAQLFKDEKKLNEVTDYLFNLLERHSLFQASEYLALKVLNETSCTIDSDLAKQLESYRAMKRGNIAPDIYFSNVNLTLGYSVNTQPKKISDIPSNYKLVIFGASWCPKCAEELIQVTKLYSNWKSKGIEVIFVSLDDNINTYQNFVKPFPFISTCDFQKWENKIVKDYYVFATPTMYLLNDKREILLKPISVKQIDAWVDWVLVQENK
jgi:thiol-disulfide isomerase/thioredoxin